MGKFDLAINLFYFKNNLNNILLEDTFNETNEEDEIKKESLGDFINKNNIWKDVFSESQSKLLKDEIKGKGIEIEDLKSVIGHKKQEILNGESLFIVSSSERILKFCESPTSNTGSESFKIRVKPNKNQKKSYIDLTRSGDSNEDFFKNKYITYEVLKNLYETKNDIPVYINHINKAEEDQIDTFKNIVAETEKTTIKIPSKNNTYKEFSFNSNGITNELNKRSKADLKISGFINGKNKDLYISLKKDNSNFRQFGGITDFKNHLTERMAQIIDTKSMFSDIDSAKEFEKIEFDENVNSEIDYLDESLKALKNIIILKKCLLYLNGKNTNILLKDLNNMDDSEIKDLDETDSETLNDILEKLKKNVKGKTLLQILFSKNFVFPLKISENTKYYINVIFGNDFINSTETNENNVDVLIMGNIYSALNPEGYPTDNAIWNPNIYSDLGKFIEDVNSQKEKMLCLNYSTNKTDGHNCAGTGFRFGIFSKKIKESEFIKTEHLMKFFKENYESLNNILKMKAEKIN